MSFTVKFSINKGWIMSDIVSQENQSLAALRIIDYQPSLLPVQIVETTTYYATKHLKIIGTGIDGKKYAVKRVSQKDNRGLIPASELFCYELARAIFLPVPYYEIVKLKDSELAFGSVWEGGVDIGDALDRVLTGEIETNNPKLILSKIYAFDLFVNNTDRHFNNYLVCLKHEKHSIIAFDFSMAWYAGVDPFGYQALNPEYDTCRYHKIIRASKHYFDAELARNTLTEIDKISIDKVEQILRRMPDSWFSMQQRQEVLAWWDSSAKTERITRLKTEIR